MKIVKPCFDHLGMFLLFGCLHHDIHACQKINLIQIHKLDFHVCVLCFKLYLLNSRKRCNFEFMLPHCWFQTLLLVIIEFSIPQHKNHHHSGWAYWLLDHTYKKKLKLNWQIDFSIPTSFFCCSFYMTHSQLLKGPKCGPKS